MKKSGHLAGKCRTDSCTFKMFISNKTQICVNSIFLVFLDHISKIVHWVRLWYCLFSNFPNYIETLQAPMLHQCWLNAEVVDMTLNQCYFYFVQWDLIYPYLSYPDKSRLYFILDHIYCKTRKCHD